MFTIKKVRRYLILPVCLLVLNAIEEVVVYKFSQLYTGKILNAYLFTFVLILMFAVGFSVVADIVAPAIATLMEKGHKKTKETGDLGGNVLFYIVAFVVLYIIYYVIYVQGPQMLLPVSWR